MDFVVLERYRSLHRKRTDRPQYSGRGASSLVVPGVSPALTMPLHGQLETVNDFIRFSNAMPCTPGQSGHDCTYGLVVPHNLAGRKRAQRRMFSDASAGSERNHLPTNATRLFHIPKHSVFPPDLPEVPCLRNPRVYAGCFFSPAANMRGEQGSRSTSTTHRASSLMGRPTASPEEPVLPAATTCRNYWCPRLARLGQCLDCAQCPETGPWA